MDKRIFAFIGALLTIAFLAGRYSAPEKVRTEIKTEIKEVKVKDATKQVETIERIIERTSKDGSKTKDTRIETRLKSENKTESETEAKIDQVKTIEARRGVTVSALVGISNFSPVYGASFSKPVLGPFTIGAFMFTDLRVGISLGLEF